MFSAGIDLFLAKAGRRHSASDDKLLRQALETVKMLQKHLADLGAVDEQTEAERAQAMGLTAVKTRDGVRSTALVSGAFLDNDFPVRQRITRAAMGDYVERFWANDGRNDDGSPVTVDLGHMGMTAKGKPRPDGEQPLYLGVVDALAVMNDHLVASWLWLDGDVGIATAKAMPTAGFSLFFNGSTADQINYTRLNRVRSIALLPDDVAPAYPVTGLITE